MKLSHISLSRNRIIPTIYYMHSVPGSVLCALYMLFHLKLQKTLKSQCYYLLLKDKGRRPQPRGPSSPSWALPSKGCAMPNPGLRGCRPLPLSGAGVQPQRSSRSPRPAYPALPRGSANPGPARAPGRLASSFSVEAILARPDPRAPTTSPLSVSAGAHGDLWNVPSRPPAQALPGACPPTWLPPCLSAGLHQPRPQPPALRPLASHFCGLQGLSVTGTRERTAATAGTG